MIYNMRQPGKGHTSAGKAWKTAGTLSLCPESCKPMAPWTATSIGPAGAANALCISLCCSIASYFFLSSLTYVCTGGCRGNAGGWGTWMLQKWGPCSSRLHGHCGSGRCCSSIVQRKSQQPATALCSRGTACLANPLIFGLLCFVVPPAVKPSAFADLCQDFFAAVIMDTNQRMAIRLHTQDLP